MGKTLRLRVVEGPCKGLAKDFTSSAVIIGRGAQADVDLDADAAVSRAHVAVQCTDQGRIFVEDMKSRAGTRWMGRPVTNRIEVPDGARIEVGGSVVLIEIVSAKQPAAPTGGKTSDIRLVTVAVGVVALAGICLFLTHDCRGKVVPPPAKVSPVDQMAQARTARDRGDLAQAESLLALLAQDTHMPAALAPEIRGALSEVRQIRQHAQAAERYESALNLQLACDEWSLACGRLTADDPLRLFIETHHIERLQRRIGRQGAP